MVDMNECFIPGCDLHDISLFIKHIQVLKVTMERALLKHDCYQVNLIASHPPLINWMDRDSESVSGVA